LTTSPYLDEWPSWSPNGDFIVFRRRQTTSGPFSLCVVPAAGGAAVPLEWPGESITGAYPDWSKDGASIVYYSGGLKRIPVDPATGAATGPPVSITTTTMYHPTWSPLDEFLTAEAAGQVVKVSPSTGVVLQTLAAGKFPDWSPAVF
jgi:TolB protein